MIRDSRRHGGRLTTAVVGVLVAALLGAAAAGLLSGRQGAADGAVPDLTASPQPTESAPLVSAAPIDTGLAARVLAMRAVEGAATQPGDVAGPAVRFTIRITNASTRTVDLADTVVNASYGVDEQPAYPLGDAGGAFPATLAAGRSATAVVTFTIPRDERGAVTVSLDTGVDHPVVAFVGAAPTS